MKKTEVKNLVSDSLYVQIQSVQKIFLRYAYSACDDGDGIARNNVIHVNIKFPTPMSEDAETKEYIVSVSSKHERK
jgi:hypothetical protein